MHDAAGAQQGPKNAPTCHGILEMMQHADALDEIEGLANGSEPQNVGPCVFDVPDAQLPRLALRVGEARCTEIDRQNPRRWKSLRRLDRLLSGAATSYEHIDLVIPTREARGFETELARQEGAEKGRRRRSKVT